MATTRMPSPISFINPKGAAYIPRSWASYFANRSIASSRGSPPKAGVGCNNCPHSMRDFVLSLAVMMVRKWYNRDNSIIPVFPTVTSSVTCRMVLTIRSRTILCSTRFLWSFRNRSFVHALGPNFGAVPAKA